MKRILIYLLAIALLPQAVSAAVLVGKTEGVFSVSPTGAATYTIPIKVQSGLSDFVPSISLTYSSQSGNGIVGMGFGISGLSSISIVPKSIYFDNKAKALSKDDDNAFVLDGMRLLQTNGADVDNGKTGAVYRTENEQYSLISITASQNGTPATFQVKATNGTTYRYGSSTGRHTLSNGKSYQWALDYAEDALGNYIQYNYSQEGVLYPTSITYGRNIHGTAGVDCTILFNYENRPDSIPVYMFGEQHFLKKRLKSIVCMYSGNIYRTYTLNYTEDVFSHLISVSETGTSSASLPPTTFVWEVPSDFQLDCNGESLETDLQEDFSKEQFFSGDLDGDGITELISMEAKPDNPLLPNYSPKRTWFYGRKWNPETQKFEFCYSYDTTAGTPILSSIIKSGGMLMHVKSGKENSLVFPFCSILGNDSKNLVFKFLDENMRVSIPMKSHSSDGEKFPPYTIFDADKDGFDDIFIIEKEQYNERYPAYLFSCDLQTGRLDSTVMYFDLQDAPDKIRCADFNSDGMADLLITTSEGYYIYWNRSGVYSDEDRYFNTAFKECDILELGDFNGDGLVDLIINKSDSEEWYIAKNTGNPGNGFFALNEINYLSQAGVKKIEDDDREEAIEKGTSKEDRFYCIVQDFNGDGKSDVVVAWPKLLVERPEVLGGDIYCGRMNFLLSDGQKLSNTSGHVFQDYTQLPDISHITIGNFFGQANAQIMYYGKGLNQESIGWYVLENPTIKPSSQKIVSITDGVGATDSIGYSLLTDQEVYSIDKSHNYPLSPLAGAMPIVKTRTESIPTDSRTTNYTYANGFVHVQGKGFLGFEDVRTESSMGIITDTHCKLDSTFYVLLPECVTQSNNNGVVLSQESSNTVLTDAGPRSYTIEQTHRNSERPLEGSSGSESEDNESFVNGSPTYNQLADNLSRVEKYITYWESPLNNVWIEGLPEEIEITKSGAKITGDDVYEKITYERDDATGLVLKETKRRNGMSVSTDGYSYNEYGQVTQHYTVAYNSTDTLVTRYEYNEKGQLRREYEPKGLYRLYTYNSTNGTLSSVRDFDGLITRYTYDGLLRETSRKRATIETCQTTRALSNYGGGAYSIKEAVTGKTPVTTYYDAWERKIAESAPLANGTVMYTDYRYNPNGKVGFVTFPHKKTETGNLGTTYYYDDPAKRLTSTVDSNGKTSTWNYTSGRVESNIDGIVTKTDYYSADKVLRVEDATGQWVEYEYNADGEISLITSEAGEASYEYDDYGRLNRVTDMNGTVREYEYDLNGNPSKTIIAGSTVVTNYDKFGILRSKSWYDSGETPHTVTYSYDSKFRLKSEKGDKYYYSYTYDSYNRLTNKLRRVSLNSQTSRELSVNVRYGSDNHVTSITGNFDSCPKQIVESLSYTDGYETYNRLNDSLVWHLKKQDRWGRATEADDSQGTTTYSFDDYGNMLSMNRSGYHPVSESYTYDIQTGNMTSKNGVPLTYDNMNQLTGYGDCTYSYDDKGNITSQPSVGDFTYDGFRVTDMSADNNYTIDDSLRISYYKAIERPRSIENEHYKAEFEYDGNGDRIMMTLYEKRNGKFILSSIRYYLDANAEIIDDTHEHYTHLYYAGGDAYTAPAAMVLDRDGNSSIYQITRDNIGSVLLYANDSGVCYENTYSPWGVRTYRVGNNTYFYQPGVELANGPFYRTYTGHEDLWMFGLLNANARLYSPYLGRFISPDPLLNSEGGPLDYNPYIYARNNPYKYIDRNGEFGLFAIFAAFNAIWSTVHNIKNIIRGGWDGVFLGGLGAVAGAFGGWAGPAFASVVGLETSSAISGAVSGAVSGLVSSTTEGLLNALYTHDWSNFSPTNCLMQTASSAVLGGIKGGLDAVHDGRSFWHGYEKGPTDVVETGHPTIGQNSIANCVGAVCEAFTDGAVSQDQIKNWYESAGGDVTEGGIRDEWAYREAARKIGKHMEVVDKIAHKRQYIFDRMKAGDDIGITYNVSEGKHNVLMKRASQSTWIKPDGSMIYRKPKLWVMDPAGGGSIRRINSYTYGKRFIRVY